MTWGVGVGWQQQQGSEDGWNMKFKNAVVYAEFDQTLLSCTLAADAFAWGLWNYNDQNVGDRLCTHSKEETSIRWSISPVQFKVVGRLITKNKHRD